MADNLMPKVHSDSRLFVKTFRQDISSRHFVHTRLLSFMFAMALHFIACLACLMLCNVRFEVSRVSRVFAGQIICKKRARQKSIRNMEEHGGTKEQMMIQMMIQNET